MRYKQGHKEQSNRRIVQVAARRFRKGGVAAVGLARVMTDAGLTNGAFYSHFASKDVLVRSVIESSMLEREEALDEALKLGVDGIQAAIADYLTRQHRDEPESGCPSAALLPEIGRAPRATRVAYTNKICQFIDKVAAQLPFADAQVRQRNAVSLFALLIGTLQLARAISDKSLSDKVLADGMATATKLIGRDESTPRPRAGSKK